MEIQKGINTCVRDQDTVITHSYQDSQQQLGEPVTVTADRTTEAESSVASISSHCSPQST